MVLEGSTYSKGRKVYYEIKSAGHTCDTMFFMSEYSWLWSDNWSKFKSQIIDSAAGNLDNAIEKFIETALELRINSFYVHSASGELWSIEITKVEE